MTSVRVDVPLAQWCDEHEIDALLDTCVKCGGPVAIDIPATIAGRPGLMSDPCATCGNTFLPFLFALPKRQP